MRARIRTGGPLLEIVPHTSHPETKAILPEGGSFYVTTVIVGTEAPALKIAGKVLGAKDLSAIALHTVSGKAGFRFRWPSGEVQIHGPLLRDVLAAAKVQVRPGGRVLVRRKPRTDIPEREVTALRAEDVLACDIVVGLRHGEGRALIPAALGGPAVLAFAPSCAASG